MGEFSALGFTHKVLPRQCLIFQFCPVISHEAPRLILEWSTLSPTVKACLLLAVPHLRTFPVHPPNLLGFDSQNPLSVSRLVYTSFLRRTPGGLIFPLGGGYRSSTRESELQGSPMGRCPRVDDPRETKGGEKGMEQKVGKRVRGRRRRSGLHCAIHRAA